MKLNTIFFDMGGTIDTFGYSREYRIKNAHLVRECLAKVSVALDWTDEQVADNVTNGASEYLRWNMKTNVELSSAEIWSRYYLKGLSISVDVLSPIAEELAFLYETKLYHRDMRKEIPDVLVKIKEMGLKMGIISNTQSLTQVRYNLEKYGIKDYFDQIILSSEYGRRKPDPAIFYHAAREAGVPTGCCAYVGDKINRDIIGAKRSGFQLAVQIKHEYDDGMKDEGAIPDAIIENMEELLPILEATLNIKSNFVTNSNNKKVKAIFFDAGDVLYIRPQRDEQFNKFLTENSIQFPEDFDEKRQELKELAFRGKMGRHDYYKNVLELCNVHDETLLNEGVKALSKDDDNVLVIEGVPQTIQQLKEKGYVLGIITDTAMPITKKLNWFDQNGFGGLWDVFVSSKEMGVRKPDPMMYEKAIRQVGLTPSETVFVGHKNSELEGARSSGMHTIAFNYDEDAEAEYYINQFCDLLKVTLFNT